MSKLKIFAAAVVVSITLDMVAWDGFYRRKLGRDIIVTADHVSSLNWHGLNPDA